MASQGVFDQLDDETASSIIQVQREDAEELVGRIKGKQKEGDQPDSDLALRLCLEELSLYETFRADLQMARRIGTTVITDAVVLREAIRMEHQAETDRTVASSLQYGPTHDVQISGHPCDFPGNEDLDNVTIAKLEARHFAEMLNLPQKIAGLEEPQEESSKWASRRSPTYLDSSSRCAACSDNKPWFDVVTTLCGDEYCTDCISTLFEMSMTDESLYPPRCCRQAIPFKSAKPFLRQGLAKTFELKIEELETKNRTYCPAPSCTTLILTSQITNEGGICPQCTRSTCVTCKTPAHHGDCPNDKPLQDLLTTANTEGRQWCHQCLRMMELDTEYNHIMQVQFRLMI